jgi:hypothetical protein
VGAGTLLNGLLAAAQEVDYVVIPEAAVAALADTEERELASVAESLHGVDVQMQHVGDLGGRHQLPYFVGDHWFSRVGTIPRQVVRSAWFLFG